MSRKQGPRAAGMRTAANVVLGRLASASCSTGISRSADMNTDFNFGHFFRLTAAIGQQEQNA